MSDSLTEQVRHLVAHSFNLPLAEISGSSGQGNPAVWDSFGHLNLVLSIEQDFNVQLKPEEVERMTTVDAIVQTLRQRL